MDYILLFVLSECSLLKTLAKIFIELVLSFSVIVLEKFGHGIAELLNFVLKLPSFSIFSIIRDQANYKRDYFRDIVLLTFSCRRSGIFAILSNLVNEPLLLVIFTRRGIFRDFLSICENSENFHHAKRLENMFLKT